MIETTFNRDEMARWYAAKHLKTYPGTKVIYYLTYGTPAREIRFLEVNDMIIPRDVAPLEPLDFGVDIRSPEGHTLMVLDVTPAQFERIHKNELALPKGWSLDHAIPYFRPGAE